MFREIANARHHGRRRSEHESTGAENYQDRDATLKAEPEILGDEIIDKAGG